MFPLHLRQNALKVSAKALIHTTDALHRAVGTLKPENTDIGSEIMTIEVEVIPAMPFQSPCGSELSFWSDRSDDDEDGKNQELARRLIDQDDAERGDRAPGVPPRTVRRDSAAGNLNQNLYLPPQKGAQQAVRIVQRVCMLESRARVARIYDLSNESDDDDEESYRPSSPTPIYKEMMRLRSRSQSSHTAHEHHTSLPPPPATLSVFFDEPASASQVLLPTTEQRAMRRRSVDSGVGML